MFVITLPVSVKSGDVVDCTINGEPKKVLFYGAHTLMIGPDDERTIIDMWVDGALRHFVCSDAEADGGTDGIVVVR